MASAKGWTNGLKEGDPVDPDAHLYFTWHRSERMPRWVQQWTYGKTVWTLWTSCMLFVIGGDVIAGVGLDVAHAGPSDTILDSWAMRKLVLMGVGTGPFGSAPPALRIEGFLYTIVIFVTIYLIISKSGMAHFDKKMKEKQEVVNKVRAANAMM